MCYKEPPTGDEAIDPISPTRSPAQGILLEPGIELLPPPPPPPPPKMAAATAPGYDGVIKVIEGSNNGGAQGLSDKTSSVFAPAARESHHDRPVSGGLSPTKRRFGNGAGGRMLSQIYSGTGSSRNSREIDFKHVDKSDLANGPDHDGLRVQHFLRTSQVHSVKQKPLSGRSDSSSDIGRLNSGCRS